MKTSFNKIASLLTPVFFALFMDGCTKANYDDDFPKGDPPPIGAYTSSDQIAPADLVAYFPFDGSAADSKGAVTGGAVSGGGSFTEGKKGKAYQGAMNSFISYTGSGPLSKLTSFTVSMWINTSRHDGGAQGIFALPNNDPVAKPFWSNFFIILEGAGPSDGMLLKLHFEKHVTPSVSNVEHWIEYGGDIRNAAPMNDMYGSWRHVAYTYDESSSKVAMYVSGNPVALPAATMNRTSDGTNPLGPLAFINANPFVIGGYQNHLGGSFNSPEVWMLTYTGKLDEMRFYKKALSASDVNALFQLEKQGR